MVNCARASGNMGFPETMIKEIINDDNAGFGDIPNSASAAEARTYGPDTREEALVRAGGKGM